MSKDYGVSYKYFSKLKLVLDALDFTQFDSAIELIEKKWRNQNQVIIMGNGGSALTSLHYINDWNKSIFLSTDIPFRGRTLVDNVGLVMSYANDLCYEDIFVEQLKNVLQPDDLVIGISGSGNSENVLRGIDYANQNDAITLGVCGYHGGHLKERADKYICANIDDMQLSEDVHFIFGHIVMQHLCGMGK
jgi:D-sedoheptulose 7-phosphate isomerase